MLGVLRLETRFLTAAITSNLREIAACIEAGVNINAYIRGGCNALHIAAEKGDVPLAVTLSLSPDLNYNAKTDIGYTPLILACLIRKRSFVKFILNHNADPNATDHYGKTALHYICRMDAIDLALELFRHSNVDVNKSDCYGATPLLIALLEANSLHMAKLLFKNGASMNVGPERSLPLFLECVTVCNTARGIELIIFLLKAGADVNMIDRSTGKTALHLIAITGFLPLASQLIAFGAKANKTDVCGRTPCKIAYMHGNYSLSKYLYREETKAGKKEKNPKLEQHIMPGNMQEAESSESS